MNGSRFVHTFLMARVAPVATPPVRQRVVFIDLARVTAILLMVQGHTIEALLAVEYRATAAFHVWSFARGVTSCLFFFLAGFAFVLATYTGAGKRRASATRLQRVRRLTLFLLVGYALHLPTPSVSGLTTLTGQQWNAFLAVDALQCLAVMLGVLQVLALATRTSKGLLLLTLPLAVTVVLMTPAMWRVDWTIVLPSPIAAYLTSGSGSLFPLFPWGAYILSGAAIGAVYVSTTHPARIATRVLGATGLALLLGSVVGAAAPWEPFGSTAYWSTSPNQFLLRAGLVCCSVAVLAYASRGLSRLPWALDALARHSLVVYAVHLCVIYGSAWNHGLRHWYGNALSPVRAVVVVIVMWGVMIGLAYCWHSRIRHLRPAHAITHARAMWRDRAAVLE